MASPTSRRFFEGASQEYPSLSVPLEDGTETHAVVATAYAGGATFFTSENHAVEASTFIGAFVSAVAGTDITVTGTAFAGAKPESIIAPPEEHGVTATAYVGAVADTSVGMTQDHAIEATVPAGAETGASVTFSENHPIEAVAFAGAGAGAAVTQGEVHAVVAAVYAALETGTARAQLTAEERFEAIGDIGVEPGLSGTVEQQFSVFGNLSAPELPLLRTLGCGVYEVWLLLRGGTPVRKLIDVSDIRYNRILNDISTATITIGQGGGQSLSDSCCAAISDIEPWKHEIAVFRGSDGTTGVRNLVWVGPVRRIEIDAERGEAVITARDLFSWFDRRFFRGEAPANGGILAAGGDAVPDLDVDDTDLSYIWAQVVNDALLPQNPGIVVEQPNETGIPAARFVGRGQYRYAGDVLRELSNSGIDYTMVNRQLRAGATEIQTPAAGLLIDEHFAVPPRIIIDGDDMATRWVVGGSGTGQDGPDEAGDTSLTLYVSDSLRIDAINPITDEYGLIEQYIFQPEIEDHPGSDDVSTLGGAGRPSYPYFNGADNTDASYSIYQAAVNRWEMHHTPYVTIEEGELSPNAPFDFNTLIPGAVLRVALRSGCHVVQGYYRIREVSVSVDDKRDRVDVRFENLGASATVVPIPGDTPSDLPIIPSGSITFAIESIANQPGGGTSSTQQNLNSCIGTNLNERPITVYGSATAAVGTLIAVRIFLDGVAIRDITPVAGTFQYGAFDPEDYVDHLFFMSHGTHTISAAPVSSVDGVEAESGSGSFTINDSCDSIQPHVTLTSISSDTVSIGDTITVTGTITGSPGATSVNAYWCIDGYAPDYVSPTFYPGSSHTFTETITIPTDLWNPIVPGLHSIQLIAVDDDFGSGDWSNSLSLTIV